MSFASKPVILLLSIVSVFGADKEKRFEPGPIDSYPGRLTIQKLTIAADPFGSEEKTRQAFGKLNPNQYGVLPVLLVMKNDGGETISLETMRIEYIQPSRQRIEATPAADVRRIGGGQKPKIYPGPLPTPTPRLGGKKNPLTAEEIEGRAFAARMLPPGESASGFVYFQASHRPGSVLYITGVREAATRRELFYFEIPLDR
jgi:hypothetical protein